jgi:hypothetical protein
MAHALLNASRPLTLADNPLLDEAAVAQLAEERYSGCVMGRELALGDLAREAGGQVLTRLGNDRRLARERAVIEAVLAGSSVRSVAIALGISREHLSNTAWRTVTDWVLEAFDEASSRARRTGGTRTVVRRLSPVGRD